jgi:site-specific DNA recombinase
MTLRSRTGREYLRVSQDRSGRARSVDEQHEDNEKAAATRGVTLGTPYEDKSVSASRYATKARDGFTDLLADLDGGRFGADELWLWEPSRGSRRVGEWVHLIEACERAGVTLYVTTHGRTYDPTNARDRRSLLEDAVDSEYESSKVSLRAKRAAAANAAEGLPHGPTPYGYQRIYDPHTRRLVRQEPHPEEAPVVRELYDRLLTGHSLRSIALDFEARGIRTRARGRDGEATPGKPFSAQHLRAMVVGPVYAGLRVHNPGKTGSRHDLTGAVKGTWEPLVPEATYYAVRHMLMRPERKTTRPGRAKHLLSFVAKCAECGSHLSYAGRSGGVYQCHKKGCVRISEPELDDLAEAMILDYLAMPEVYEPVAAAENGDEQMRQVRDDLAKARAELHELREGVATGHLSVANLTAVEPRLLARVTALEEQERELSTPSALRQLIAPGKDVCQTWAAAPLSTRREVARRVLRAERVGELYVTRRPRSAGNRHVPADQRALWRKGDRSDTVTPT